MSQALSTKQKLTKIQESQVKADLDLFNEDIIQIKLEPDLFFKTGNRFQLLDNYFIPYLANGSLANGNVYSYIFLIESFTENQIINSKIDFDIYASSAWEGINVNSYAKTSYMWERLSSTIYHLHISLSNTSNTIPLFANVYLYFNNNSNYFKR